MNVRTVILLVHCLLGTGLAMQCREVSGKLKQIDAGVGQVFGVNENDGIYTLYGGPWTQLPGALKHVTVGPSGVWGANANNLWAPTGFRCQGVFPTACLGNTDWQLVAGKLVMIEVGTDGSVYGVNAAGNVYRRDGISACEPVGMDWTFLSECGKSKREL
ncbi:hypothetical protein SKAU_G00223120 [Synaphobranchus kaupii]|uniref:Uncharacterized protein n=1 Tax=Synaphobranchus kaupii TaxID=118154 RepID=A0A9Q1FBB6_SYNKA|nr:hypothetical protein SKAU_G00223120 [Synaphobranchus kaupii]